MGPYVQTGYGYIERYTSYCGGQRKDIVEKIRVFGDIVIVVYLSGLILKFSTNVLTAKLDAQQKVVEFNLLHKFESLIDISPVDTTQIRISHGQINEANYPNGYTRIFSKIDDIIDDEDEDNDDDCSEVGIWILEDEERLDVDIEGVNNIHDLVRLGDDDYCLLTRTYDSMDEYDLQDEEMQKAVKYQTKNEDKQFEYSHSECQSCSSKQII